MSQVVNAKDDVPSKPTELPLGRYIAYFLFTCWLSILPASTIAYLWINWSIIALSNVPMLLFLSVLASIVSAYIILVLGTWLVARAGVSLVCKGKPVPDGRYECNRTSKEWRNFTARHLAKKFSMWIFQNHVPRWLYRRYIGSFIKIGKHVELPEWVAMENAEIGDNTVFARQGIISSHIIDGKILTIKTVKIGKNCIMDSDDENRRVGIMPGALVEDNVIIKPCTVLTKDTVLKAGGIYQGEFAVERVGNVADMSQNEIDAYRKAVRKKRVLKSAMITDWSSFHSPWPRVMYKLADVLGYAIAFAFLASFGAWTFPTIISSLGMLGHAINIMLLPILIVLAYGFYVYMPIPVIAMCVHRYDKVIPRLSEDPAATVTIDNPSIIDSWRKCKWLKWQAVNRVNVSLFLDTSMLVYQRIGKNNVALKTVLYNAKLDTDYIAVGDNTLLSFGCHIYAYKMENNNGKTRLILKHTIIGKNCILGTGIVHAGARIGDNVVLAAHTVVPEDAILESGKTYVGNPAIEFTRFLEMRKRNNANTRNQG